MVGHREDDDGGGASSFLLLDVVLLSCGSVAGMEEVEDVCVVAESPAEVTTQVNIFAGALDAGDALLTVDA